VLSSADLQSGPTVRMNHSRPSTVAVRIPPAAIKSRKNVLKWVVKLVARRVGLVTRSSSLSSLMRSLFNC
jgi:hypothetical protein